MTNRWQLVRRRIWRAGLRGKYLLWQRHRFNRLVLEQVGPYALVVLPGVMNPALFRTGAFLAERLDERLIPPGSTVLDMGTGSGVIGLAASQWAEQVISVDINPEAVRCARINGLLNQCEDRISVKAGDLFAPVVGQRFDVILFNPPYYRGSPKPGFEQAWRGHSVVERFNQALPDYVTEDGYALLVLSTDGELADFLVDFERHNFRVTTIVEQDMGNERVLVYKLQPVRAGVA